MTKDGKFSWPVNAPGTVSMLMGDDANRTSVKTAHEVHAAIGFLQK